jgi:beta-alanine degradation protein BauB
MKASLLITFVILMFTGLIAQDPIKVASNVYKKVVLDNDKVRVLDVEFSPGDVAPMHSHPDHVIYALSDGKLEITDKGKQPQTMEIKAGTSMYIPAVTHTAKNVGENYYKADCDRDKTYANDKKIEYDEEN